MDHPLRLEQNQTALREPISVAGGSMRTVPLSRLAGEPEFADAWRRDVHANGDIYMYPEYLAAEDAGTDGTIVLCRFDCAHGSVLHAMLVRPIGAADPKAMRFDAISPFEYGGPILSAPTGRSPQRLIAAAQAALSELCERLGVVSEFVRFNPVLGNHAGWRGHYKIRKSCDNVVVDLTSGTENIFANYSESQRRNIRLARRDRISIETATPSPSACQAFLDIYRATMNRLGADTSYYFSEQYFETLFRMNSSFLGCYRAISGAGEDLAALLVISAGNTAHSHLMGTSARGLKTKAGSLLYHEAILDLKTKGIEIFHLGGAAPSQTGVMDFKARFSPMRRPYHVGTHIYDHDAYRALCARAGLADDTGAEGFFPTYRALSGPAASLKYAVAER